MTAVVKDTVNTVLEKLHVSSDEKTAPPREPTTEELQALQQKYKEAKQDHVWKFYESLSSSEKGIFYDQLSGIDPHYIKEVVQKTLHPQVDSKHDKEASLKPLPESSTASILDSSGRDIERWYSHGLQLISENKVAVVLMAGGQGTRLGSSAPKGCFDIGLPSHKSLFQIQAERIVKVQRLAQKKCEKNGVVVPWYIMTSGPTRAPTEKFFEEHKYFGLKKSDVVIFEQGVLPCVSNDGKILLESKSKVRRGWFQIRPC